MRHEGTFEPVDGGAPLVGPGSVEVRADGLLVTGEAERRVLASVLAIAVGLAVTAVVVVITLEILDALGRISDGESLRPAVGTGTVALAGTFWLGRRLLPRLLPKRRLETLVAYRYVLSADARERVLDVVLTAPACEGRLAFRTHDPEALHRAIAAAKQAG